MQVVPDEFLIIIETINRAILHHCVIRIAPPTGNRKRPALRYWSVWKIKICNFVYRSKLVRNEMLYDRPLKWKKSSLCFAPMCIWGPPQCCLQPLIIVETTVWKHTIFFQPWQLFIYAFLAYQRPACVSSHCHSHCLNGTPTQKYTVLGALSPTHWH